MAVTKKKKKKVNKKERGLNINQKRFCELYTKNSALFGNASLCYAIAYEYDLDSLSTDSVYATDNEGKITEKISDSPYEKAIKVCRVNGSKLLTIASINEYINKLLNDLMTDENADSELAWVMQQRSDLGPKVQALREYNKIKGRIIDKKQVEVTGLSIKDLYNLAKEE